MKVIKKFTAIQIDSVHEDEQMNVRLTYGYIDGPYYSREYPEEIFETEEKAIEYAYKTNKYSNWLILPIISFEDNE